MSPMIANPSAWAPSFQQQCFRKILDGVSYPGTVESLGEDVSPLLATLACLADRMSTIHDRDALVDPSWRGLLGARFTDLGQAQFVVAHGSLPPAETWTPPLGTLSSPELGATVLLQCDHLKKGPWVAEITGPGIEGRSTNRVSGLHPDWITRRQDWVADFPKGVDFILVSRTDLLAWPRTSTIRVR